MAIPNFISPARRKWMKKNGWTITHTITSQRMEELSTFLRSVFKGEEWWKLMISAGAPASGRWKEVGITHDRKGRLVIGDLGALALIGHECMARGMQSYADQLRYGYADKDFWSGLKKGRHKAIEQSFIKAMKHIDQVKRFRGGRRIDGIKSRLYVDLAKYLISVQYLEPRDSTKLADHIRTFLKGNFRYREYSANKILNSFTIWKKRHEYSIEYIAAMSV